MASPKKKVAIVGSGCAGLGAAWALRDSDYEVHMFEKSPTLGGHTDTQTWTTRTGTTAVDTGFIIMNTATYPNFIRFLQEVGVDTVPTVMSFGVSRDHGAFEWSGDARGIFAQRRNLFSLRHWRLIFDIIRFNQFALDLLVGDDDVFGGQDRLGRTSKCPADLRIGEFLDREGYSQAFQDDYLIPMTAAVWSTSPDKASLEFPARTLIRFMWNHHLLSTLAARPLWLTIPGGSQRYIDAVLRTRRTQRLVVHTSCEVKGIRRPPPQSQSNVFVSWVDSDSGLIGGEWFDHVILACHGDEILPLLTERGSWQHQTNHLPNTGSKLYSEDRSKPFAKLHPAIENITQEESDVFSAFQTTENICYLHSDIAFMPKRRAVWTSWNYLVSSTPSKLSHPTGVSLTYCMNLLQHIPEGTFGPVLVTMNPKHKPDPALTQGKFIYRHPLYTVEAVQAQKRLEKIQNVRGMSYCGAWTKYGFHEDGFSSGLRVAIEHLGAKLPFEFVDSTYSRGHTPELHWKDHLLRIAILWLLILIRISERFDALYRDLCTTKLNKDGTTKLDPQGEKEQQGAVEALRKIRSASAKKNLIQNGLSTLAHGGGGLPEELREVVLVAAAVLEGPLGGDDVDLLYDDIQKFKTNVPLIARELSRLFNSNLSTLSSLALPDDPASLVSWISSTQDSVSAAEDRVGAVRLQIAQEFAETQRLSREITETSIRILEQTIHGSVARSTRARADHLATVAEGMSKKLQLQHNQLLAATYSGDVQGVLATKSEALERESAKTKREIRELEAQLEEYRRVPAMESIAKEYAEILREEQRLEGEIARLKGRR